MKLLDSSTNKMLSYIEYNCLIIPFMTAVFHNYRNYSIIPATIFDIQKKDDHYEVTFEEFPEPFEMSGDPNLELIMSLSPEQYVTNTRTVLFLHPDETYSAALIYTDAESTTDDLEISLNDDIEQEIIKDCLETLHLDTEEKVDRFIHEGQELYKKDVNNLHEELYSKILYMQDEVD